MFVVSKNLTVGLVTQIQDALPRPKVNKAKLRLARMRALKLQAKIKGTKALLKNRLKGTPIVQKQQSSTTTLTEKAHEAFSKLCSQYKRLFDRGTDSVGSGVKGARKVKSTRKAYVKRAVALTPVRAVQSYSASTVGKGSRTTTVTAKRTKATRAR